MARTVSNPNTTDYQIWRFHDSDGGIVVCPVQSATPKPLRVIRTKSPVETVTVAWSVTREGSPPEVPSYMDLPTVDSNHVFLRGKRAVLNPVPDVEKPQVQTWTMIGVYVYALINAVGLDSDFPTAKLPFEGGVANDNTIPASFFKTGLLGGPAQVLQNGIVRGGGA